MTAVLFLLIGIVCCVSAIGIPALPGITLFMVGIFFIVAATSEAGLWN